MNTALKPVPHYRGMMLDDLDDVMSIERQVYAHPWTRGNFSDSMSAGYLCTVMTIDRSIAGYSVVMPAPDEAHLLNLAIAAGWQRRGLGRELLFSVIEMVRANGLARIYLEVRPSNKAGLALYAAAGFRQIGFRRDYYPAGGGREDALVMEMVVS